jgi:methyl-accepting chemotaxis protein
VAEGIAEGDLNQNVTPASERDVLGGALEKMVRQLNDLVFQIQEAVGQIVSGSGEVSDSSQSLSQGASEQAASLEEITSSIAELSSQTKSNAENAGQANQLSTAAQDAAERGNKHMASTIEAMNEINDSSQEIAKIIKVIDDIAFQTNLLALNAAVEAARAGKYGKGFAVVAQEVRNLAGRSATAAKETSELIANAVQKVEHGREMVNATAEALGEIVDGATKVSDLIDEIAAASNEQSQGITQIDQALGQIEQVTHQNTANAEETASASEELTGQAYQLKEMVASFKTKKRTAAASKPAETHRPKMIEQTKTESRKPAPRTPEAQTSTAGPDDYISLDDDEFGKF